jgi:hypothetical protein
MNHNDQDCPQRRLCPGCERRHGWAVVMILSKLDGIASRIAIAIVLAIILGLVMAFGLNIGLNSYGSRQDRSPVASSTFIMVAVIAHRNLPMLSGKIAMTIRAAASVPRPERQKVIAISAAQLPKYGLPSTSPRLWKQGLAPITISTGSAGLFKCSFRTCPRR